MKKQPTKKPHAADHEPALCPECLRVRELENTVRKHLRDAEERLRYAEAALAMHNYQTLSENVTVVKMSAMRAAEYAATLESERRSVLDRGIIPVKSAESAT